MRTKTKSSLQGGKYHNKKTEVHGISFDSKKEAARYQELLLLERAGQIENLEIQPRLDLVVNNCKIGFYKGDFRYKDLATGNSVLEDVKGMKTPVYNLKRKLVKALYGIDIVEV
jgi:hypothetical protein